MTTPVAPAFATIFHHDEWPLVQALADGLSAHHPGATLWALSLTDQAVDAVPANVAVLAGGVLKLGDDALNVLRVAARPSDARMVLAPVLVAYVARTAGVAWVVYLAPDTVVRRPVPVPDEPGVHMLPRFTAVPADDGRTPEPADLLRLSEVDDGFLAATPDAAGALAGAFQPAFDAALASDAALARAWDLLAVRCNAALIDDTALGVAYWNAHDRHGAFTTVRLPGLDPEAPYLLSRDQSVRPRVLLSERPDLRVVVDDQLACLRGHGMTTAIEAPRLGGLVLDDAVRHACRQALASDPAMADQLARMAEDPSGEALATWLGETWPRSREPRISRYLMGLWASDTYASTAFPTPPTTSPSTSSAGFARRARRSACPRGSCPDPPTLPPTRPWPPRSPRPQPSCSPA